MVKIYKVKRMRGEKNIRIRQINSLLLHIVNPFRMLLGDDLDVKIRLVRRAFAGFDAFVKHQSLWRFLDLWHQVSAQEYLSRQCNIIFLIKSPKTLATFD